MTEDEFKDRESLESIFGKRLRAVAEKWFEGKTYGGEGPDDLVQRTLARVIDNEEWKQYPTRELFFGYLCVTMRHDFLDVTRKHGRAKRADLSDAITSESVKNPPSQETEVELQSYARFLKSFFPGNKRMHQFIDLWLANKKPAEIAEVLGLDEVKKREVSKLRTQLLEKVKPFTKREMISGH
jgi:DNA-directed RNA polymerase specialized sigma24 family protein